MILWSSLNLHLLHIIKTDIILIRIIVVKMYSMLVLKNIKFPFLHYKNFKQTIVVQIKRDRELEVGK